MTIVAKLADRTAVLFLGVAVGAAMGYAFAGGGDRAADTGAAGGTAKPAATQQQGQGQGPAHAKPAALLSPAAAAAQDARATPFQPNLLHALASGGKVRVGVFGDSYGDGIWAALYRLLPRQRDYEVLKFSQQATGFTRYASLNLEDHTREQIAGTPIDIAVISFGANDTQGVWADGHAAALLSPKWQEVIGNRVAGFVKELRDQGAIVYWVGLPKMRKPSFDSDIAGMNAFYARKMKELGVPWIETASLTVDEQGNFAPYLPDGPDHERTLIRANDGIHMSMTGYVRIVRALAHRIDAYVDSARAKAGVRAPASAAAPASASGASPSHPAPSHRAPPHPPVSDSAASGAGAARPAAPARIS